MFWAPCSSCKGAGGWGVSGDIWGHGDVPTHVHMHAHTHTHTHVYMWRNCKWPLTWRHPCLSCSSCLTCMCKCVHAYIYGTPPHTPIPTPPRSTHLPPPQGGPWHQSKFNNTWTNQNISIPFEDLKSVETSPPMGGCMVWWVGGWLGWWLGSGQITKNLINVDPIKIIQFCLKIYDF